MTRLVCIKISHLSEWKKAWEIYLFSHYIKISHLLSKITDIKTWIHIIMEEQIAKKQKMSKSHCKLVKIYTEQSQQKGTQQNF